jgi:nucleoporin POM152
LNPDKLNFCLNSTVTSVEIPILINQTEPVELDLVRLDFDTNQNETITIKRKELSGLLKKARKAATRTDPEDPLLLRYTVKKPGVYLLKKVVDQSKLEVRPRSTNAIVVTCPLARVKPTGNRRCRNDLSNVELEVEGVPPLYVKYRLTVDRQLRGGSEFENLQPNEFVSPLSRHTSQALVKSGKEDVSWARSQRVTVPLNETLATGSGWEYAIEEVHDGLGNLVSFVGNEDEEHPKAKTAGTYHGFEVHERPKVSFQGCNPQKPKRVAKGNKEPLPIKYESTGKDRVDAPHRVQYLFTPEADIVADGYHSANAVVSEETIKPGLGKIFASDAGLYTLKSVSTEFCEGDVLEPTSCLVQNPPVPELELSSEDIIDKCAGNPIGLRVDMDFIGSPPFFVKYIEQQKGKNKALQRDIRVDSLKGSIDLAPENTGHYTYTFKSISDDVYQDRPLHNLVLQQEVRAPASAHFIENRPKQVCIDDYAEFDVELTGDGPYKLEYEVIHNGKRSKQAVDVEGDRYTIKTPNLKNGGEYTVALVSIVDARLCKDTLKNQEAKVQVRHERPKAYFGLVDGKQSIMALEGKKVDLPLRLSGVGPWSVEYENLDTDQKERVRVPSANAPLSITQQGTYHLRSVSDSVCPGFIEEKASTFNVGWIARPQISIPETSSIVFEYDKYTKDAVCEGDEDSFEVALLGTKIPSVSIAFY